MFDTFRNEDRAVSPVIGVILMVAITVILAAVIGTFVLGLGDDIQTNVQAGASVTSSSGSDTVGITYTSNQTANYLTVNATGDINESGDFTLQNPGDKIIINKDSTATLSGDATQESTDARLNADDGSVNVVVTAHGDETQTVLISEEYDY
jgi:flagellin-like protein